MMRGRYVLVNGEGSATRPLSDRVIDETHDRLQGQKLMPSLRKKRTHRGEIRVLNRTLFIQRLAEATSNGWLS